MDLGKHSLISRDQQELQPLMVTLGKASPASLSRGSIPSSPLLQPLGHLSTHHLGAERSKHSQVKARSEELKGRGFSSGAKNRQSFGTGSKT